jgi:hypothetical protein
VHPSHAISVDRLIGPYWTSVARQANVHQTLNEHSIIFQNRVALVNELVCRGSLVVIVYCSHLFF